MHPKKKGTSPSSPDFFGRTYEYGVRLLNARIRQTTTDKNTSWHPFLKMVSPLKAQRETGSFEKQGFESTVSELQNTPQGRSSGLKTIKKVRGNSTWRFTQHSGPAAAIEAEVKAEGVGLRGAPGGRRAGRGGAARRDDKRNPTRGWEHAKSEILPDGEKGVRIRASDFLKNFVYVSGCVDSETSPVFQTFCFEICCQLYLDTSNQRGQV